jgi:hypothetical protein
MADLGTYLGLDTDTGGSSTLDGSGLYARKLRVIRRF